MEYTINHKKLSECNLNELEIYNNDISFDIVLDYMKKNKITGTNYKPTRSEAGVQRRIMQWGPKMLDDRKVPESTKSTVRRYINSYGPTGTGRKRKRN